MRADACNIGVHSDAEIKKNKGPPLMTEEERYQLDLIFTYISGGPAKLRQTLNTDTLQLQLASGSMRL